MKNNLLYFFFTSKARIEYLTQVLNSKNFEAYF